MQSEQETPGPPVYGIYLTTKNDSSNQQTHRCDLCPIFVRWLYHCVYATSIRKTELTFL